MRILPSSGHVFCAKLILLKQVSAEKVPAHGSRIHQVPQNSSLMKTDPQSPTGLQRGPLLRKKKLRLRPRIFPACGFLCTGTACGGCMRLPIIPRISNGAESLPAPFFNGVAGTCFAGTKNFKRSEV